MSKDFTKYEGVIPAFYACYDGQGAVSPERVRALARYLLDKGVTRPVCGRILGRVYLSERRGA